MLYYIKAAHVDDVTAIRNLNQTATGNKRRALIMDPEDIREKRELYTLLRKRYEPNKRQNAQFLRALNRFFQLRKLDSEPRG